MSQTKEHQLTGFRKNWFIISSLVGKSFKRKYRRSILGVVWSVLNPLLTMLVLTAVFSTFFRFNIENYPLYLILGNTIFHLMSGATTDAMNSIIGSARLIKKVRIDKAIFPISKVLFQGVNFGFSLIAVAIVYLFFHIPPTFNMLFLPLLVLYVMIFSLGLGMLLAALAVFFNDMLHFWGVLITTWTYLTPIFYPAALWPEWLAALEAYNPMYHYVTYFRDIILWGNTPGFLENMICLGFAVVTLAIGWLIFKKTENKFILYI